MFGWNGRILRIDLSTRKVALESYDPVVAIQFIGGRGLAIKFLWDETKPGIDPLSPDSRLILAAGPLTGLNLPGSGKLVVAAKSPLTGGYGDGNVGTLAAVQLRRAGFDALIVTGRAREMSYVSVRDNDVDILNGEDLAGLGSFDTEDKLREKHGNEAGILTIGPAGENLVRYATVTSQKGRSGGRPGMGAVMGAKNLKAFVIEGTGRIPVSDVNELNRQRSEAYKTTVHNPNYKSWMRQGTMSIVEWAQEIGVLPTFNFREGTFDHAEEIGGQKEESLKVSQKGCPQCNMVCGIEISDSEDTHSELDYESVAMLGSNIGLGDLREVGTLNRLCDDFGIDTISAGNAIGFAMEASENSLIEKRIDWGDYRMARALLEDIAYRRGLGNLLADGVKVSADKLGGESWKWSMNVKGLEVSAYDCHSTPGMALSYGTAAVGAHHKDAWVITWEIEHGRGYTMEKVNKIIEMQRIRGGLFEVLTLCRFPSSEAGLELDSYPRLLRATTGIELPLDRLYNVSDRIYSLIRAFWIRESQDSWSRSRDMPPRRWFEDSPSRGPTKGFRLEEDGYNKMLEWYYELRGWDSRGIPRRQTLESLGLGYAAEELAKYVALS